MPEKYVAEIEFENERHCLQCPLRNGDTDGCNLQTWGDVSIEFDSWDEQMEKCPLKGG